MLSAHRRATKCGNTQKFSVIAIRKQVPAYIADAVLRHMEQFLNIFLNCDTLLNSCLKLKDCDFLPQQKAHPKNCKKIQLSESTMSLIQGDSFLIYHRSFLSFRARLTDMCLSTSLNLPLYCVTFQFCTCFREFNFSYKVTNNASGNLSPISIKQRDIGLL